MINKLPPNVQSLAFEIAMLEMQLAVESKKLDCELKRVETMKEVLAAHRLELDIKRSELRDACQEFARDNT